MAQIGIKSAVADFQDRHDPVQTGARLDEAENMVLVEGAVPGPSGGWVMIRPTKKHSKAKKMA